MTSFFKKGKFRHKDPADEGGDGRDVTINISKTYISKAKEPQREITQRNPPINLLEIKDKGRFWQQAD